MGCCTGREEKQQERKGLLTEKTANNTHHDSYPSSSSFTSASARGVEQDASSNAFKKRAIANWDFEGNKELMQLSFKIGEEIIVLDEDDQGWWWGRLGENEGYFPANYCEIIKPNIKHNENINPNIKSLQNQLKQ
eukprot:TRINITY_DN673_c0_g1_i2.p2 TRINITY_DN673_c0_g1~~TRINITY_DN673_c0_g1_i2.p2  ORF type:complete len:135 (-),score=32.95 TRINITY_DN673_c0_g1_i2:170-574(-)